MTFTIIPLEKLNETRTELKEILTLLGLKTGEKYSIRTFFIGPRPNKKHTFLGGYIRPGSTLKGNATGAKIGVYKRISTYKDWQGRTRSIDSLIRYL